MDKVVISIADDSLDRLPAVVADLAAAGLVVDDVLEALGMVTGSVAPSSFRALSAVAGVVGVERQRTVGARPPEQV
ncbi:MAG: hypothetical protein ABIQ18_12815 [Umezawaea sp.]